MSWAVQNEDLGLKSFVHPSRCYFFTAWGLSPSLSPIGGRYGEWRDGSLIRNLPQDESISLLILPIDCLHLLEIWKERKPGWILRGSQGHNLSLQAPRVVQLLDLYSPSP